MNVVLISTYELGRQPFGLASPAAWLRSHGHAVTCVDLSISSLPSMEIREADLVAFYLPMHTATRLAVPVVERVRRLNPSARLCGYGLYASMSEELLRSAGIESLIGGEFEASLTALADGAGDPPLISLDRLRFLPPDRSGLPKLSRYPKLITPEGKRRVGYTEASRGCKHRCRHCPVVPVYDGRFRVVQADVILEDIRRQVAEGAQHISFGDPDFLNGPAHARRVIEAFHREFPEVTWDATIKVEHLLQHRNLLPLFRDSGCAFIITAAESIDDRVLTQLEKGHTRDDFFRVVELCQNARVALTPTFIPFTPWTTLESYSELLSALTKLDLVDSVAPVQLTLRLLITKGSRLLELEEVRSVTGAFDPSSLVWQWKHRDLAVDALGAEVLRVVHASVKIGASRREVFYSLWQLTQNEPLPVDFTLMPRTVVPYMEEPWFC